MDITDTRQVGGITAEIKTADNQIFSVKETFWANFRWWFKKKPLFGDDMYAYVRNASLLKIKDQIIEGFGFSK